MNHAPGAGLLAGPVEQQSSALPLHHGRPPAITDDFKALWNVHINHTKHCYSWYKLWDKSKTDIQLSSTICTFPPPNFRSTPVSRDQHSYSLNNVIYMSKLKSKELHWLHVSSFLCYYIKEIRQVMDSDVENTIQLWLNRSKQMYDQHSFGLVISIKATYSDRYD